MSTQRYSVTPHPIETLLTWIKSGEIAIPEIQRPFVWEATKVRNLLDSLYQGYPNVIVASAVARAAGDAGRHIRERGFDKRYYLDLILALVREHQPVDRRDVDQLLLTKLPDRLSQEQKLRKVHNLLQELRRSGLIDNRGSRSKPRWVTVKPTPTEDGR